MMTFDEIINEVLDNQAQVFCLGFYSNPYSRASEREYFWFSADSKSEAKAAFDRKMKNGQPKTFRDWVPGQAKYFTDIDKFKAACSRVGLTPNLD